jgi:hypothetical protein
MAWCGPIWPDTEKTEQISNFKSKRVAQMVQNGLPSGLTGKPSRFER